MNKVIIYPLETQKHYDQISCHFMKLDIIDVLLSIDILQSMINKVINVKMSFLL